MNKSRFFIVASIASAMTLSTPLFATTGSAAPQTEHKIITETPVHNLKVEVEDMPSDSAHPYQRIQLHITAEALLPSGREESIDRIETSVPVPIKEVSGALSLTLLFRDGTTVLARERPLEGEFFAIGQINEDQELVLSSKYRMSVVYRQYRYSCHDRIIGTLLGADTRDFDSVPVRIINN